VRHGDSRWVAALVVVPVDPPVEVWPRVRERDGGDCHHRALRKLLQPSRKAAAMVLRLSTARPRGSNSSSLHGQSPAGHAPAASLSLHASLRMLIPLSTHLDIQSAMRNPPEQHKSLNPPAMRNPPDVTPDFLKKTKCISYVRQDQVYTHMIDVMSEISINSNKNVQELNHYIISLLHLDVRLEGLYNDQTITMKT
jgi:hypothetical protein